MDEVQEHEPEKPSFSVEPNKAGFLLEDSRFGFSSGLYLDESLEKGLGSGDASSILRYGLNCDDGGLDSNAFGEGEDAFKDRNVDKMPSEDGAVDLFSASGLSNASEDYFWDFDFSKKFPDLDYKFCEESDSWNSGLVSQSSESSSKAVGVSEQYSQILECENNQPEKLITRESDGNYMPSFVWDMLMNDETGVNSSYSYGLHYIGDVKNIASPVETSESCHCSNEGYFGTSHDHKHMGASCTSFSLSMQCYDATLVDEGTEAGNSSLQGGSFNKPAYSCDLQDFSQVSPMDTIESYDYSDEGHFGTSHDLNHLGAEGTCLSVQCSDASLVDDSKADDPSMLSILINHPASSCVPQDFSEVSPMDTTESYPCYNDGYNGASHDPKHLRRSCSFLSMQCCAASLVDEDTEADDPSPSFQGVLINKPACSCDPLGEVKINASLVETNESDHRSKQGYFGTTLELNHLGPLGTSFSIQCSGASPEDEDAEADHPTLQGISVNKPTDTGDLQDIAQVKIVAGPMETRKFYHRRKKGHCGSSLQPNSLGAPFTSMFMQFSDASLVDEDTKADDPSMQGFMQFSDASLVDEDTKADDPSMQGFSMSKPAGACDPQGIGKSVASPVDTGESHEHENEGYAGTSNDLDHIPQGSSRDSIFVRGTDASPMAEDTEEDDPTLQSILIDERAKCRKVGSHLRRKRVKKSSARGSNDSPTFKTRHVRRKEEESTKSSKRKHVEAKSQNKRHRKGIKDVALVAHNALTRRSSKQGGQGLGSDDEYDPFNTNLKIRGSKGGDRRKNSKLWTLSEVMKLVDGISKFGVGKWTPVQKSLFNSPPYRTPLDIRDKWRNLIKTSAVRLKYMEEEFSQKNGSMEMPKSLLERICELDRVHPYLRSDVKRRWR